MRVSLYIYVTLPTRGNAELGASRTLPFLTHFLLSQYMLVNKVHGLQWFFMKRGLCRHWFATNCVSEASYFLKFDHVLIWMHLGETCLFLDNMFCYMFCCNLCVLPLFLMLRMKYIVSRITSLNMKKYLEIELSAWLLIKLLLKMCQNRLWC